MISISDNGQGILPQIHDRVFEKGFTTKDDGNGLGLYHAKVEVEKYGGTISFITQNQKGTTFTISLPEKYSIIAWALLPEPEPQMAKFIWVI